MNINPLNAPKKSNLPDPEMDIVSTSPRNSKVKTSNGKKSPLIVLMFIALIAAIGAAGFFFYQTTQLKQKVENPTQVLDEQSKSIKDAVGKFYDLGNPDDYSVASITNVDNLKKDNPEFYANAKNGNYLIVSQKKAILYDKDQNKILNVAPIINNPTDTGTPSTAPAATNTPAPTSTSTPTVEPTKKK